MNTTTESVHAVRLSNAEGLLLELLAERPHRLAELRAEAKARGLDVSESAWKKARRRLGVESFGSGRVWWLRLPGAAFEQDLAAWLDSPEGQRAARSAELDRRLDAWLAEHDPQMALEIES